MNAPYDLKSYENAKAIIDGIELSWLAEEPLSLLDSVGRILSQDLFAPMDSPIFTQSAMDGYGFVFQNEFKTPLKVVAHLHAGSAPSDVLPGDLVPEQCAVRIMTGAPLPSWVDTVIPLELCEPSQGGQEVVFNKIPSKGSNIRVKGEDLPKGSLLLKRGTSLTPEHIMVAAAFGFSELPVFRYPKLVLCSTGNELKTPGSPLEPGEIYNSSRYFLDASLRQQGIKHHEFIHLHDDSQVLRTFILSLVEQDQPTLVISTGSVSAGDADLIPKITLEQGFKILFHKIAIRPGKPVFLAQKGNILWLGLPGNPISTAVGWHFFARPLLARIMGLNQAPFVKLTLKNDVVKPNGLKCFYRAEVRKPFAWVSSRQGSAHFAASLTGQAYVILPEDMARIPAGTKVDALLIN